MGLVQNDAHRFAAAAPHEEYVHGACCPGWHSAGSHRAAVEQWISAMQDEGIRRVCCLIAGSPSDSDDSNLALYNDAFGRDRVKHTPVPTDRLVGVERLEEDILPFLDEAVEAEEPVVVHGLSGIGRTGQVLAAWLIHHHEYRPHEAVDTVVDMGRDPSETVDRGGATRHELLDMLARVG